MQINPDQFFNLNASKVGIIWIENSVEIILSLDSLGLEASYWVRLNRFEFWFKLKISDWDGFIFNRITSNEIQTFFRIDSGEFRLARNESEKMWLVRNKFQSETFTRIGFIVADSYSGAKYSDSAPYGLKYVLSTLGYSFNPRSEIEFFLYRHRKWNFR